MDNYGNMHLIDEVQDLLQRARNYIADEDHWVQGRLASDDWSTVCSIGALCRQRTNEPQLYGFQLDNVIDKAICVLAANVPDYFKTMTEIEHLEYRLREHPDFKAPVVAGYNDNKNTSHGDILRLFDTAIESCKATPRE